MASPAFFLALTPVNDHCHLPAQSIYISPFDNIHLLLGGKHSSYYRRQDVPHHTADFIFDHSNLEPDHAVVAYTDGTILISNTGDANAIHINGKKLATDVKQELFDGDNVELGHLDAYTSKFRCALQLRVTISDTLPQACRFHSTSNIPASSFIFTTSTALLAWNQLLASNERLSEQLDETQTRLQHTLDALHTASSIPPRTYLSTASRGPSFRLRTPRVRIADFGTDFGTHVGSRGREHSRLDQRRDISTCDLGTDLGTCFRFTASTHIVLNVECSRRHLQFMLRRIDLVPSFQYITRLLTCRHRLLRHGRHACVHTDTEYNTGLPAPDLRFVDDVRRNIGIDIGTQGPRCLDFTRANAPLSSHPISPCLFHHGLHGRDRAPAYTCRVA